MSGGVPVTEFEGGLFVVRRFSYVYNDVKGYLVYTYYMFIQRIHTMYAMTTLLLVHPLSTLVDSHTLG